MRKILILVGIMVIMLTGCTNAKHDSELILEDTLDVSVGETSIDTSESESTSCDSIYEPENTFIVVYVCGAVVKAGVYELAADSRVNDAVLAAGGFAENADETFVNLAAPVSDGTKILIPTKEEVESGTVAAESIDNTESTDGGPGLININTASKEELKTLPGIGDGIAGKIIDYREKSGSFKTIEDIMKVSGIKDKLFSKIKDMITV